MHKHIVLLNDKTIIELDFAKCRDLSVSRRSIICLCLRHRRIIDLLATDKSRYFAQPRPIIVYYCTTDNFMRAYCARVRLFLLLWCGMTLELFFLKGGRRVFLDKL